jgi:hypothetical protein
MRAITGKREISTINVIDTLANARNRTKGLAVITRALAVESDVEQMEVDTDSLKVIALDLMEISERLGECAGYMEALNAEGEHAAKFQSYKPEEPNGLESD